MTRSKVSSVPSQASLPAIRSGALFGRVTHEVRCSWLEIDGLGCSIDLTVRSLRRRLDRALGKASWAQGWRYQGAIIDATRALELYEEAHLRFLQSHGPVLDWLCTYASDVYEDMPSSVESAQDYSIQKTWTIHLQDIAVRRCLVRLGRTFEGKQLLELRNCSVEGFRLSTGVIPFHEPGEILPVEGELAWWRPQSVEAFWQNNKVLLVDPDRLNLEPLLAGPDGLWCQLDQAIALLVPADGGRRLQAGPMEQLRNRTKTENRQDGLVPVADAYRMPYRQVAPMAVNDLCGDVSS